jgi:hypothetical protein
MKNAFRYAFFISTVLTVSAPLVWESWARAGETPSSVPSSGSSPGAPPSASPSLIAPGEEQAPAAVPPLSDSEVAELRRRFEEAQAVALKAQEHRQRLELKEFDKKQKKAWKEWNAEEKRKRREFFRDHVKGPHRRAYVQEFLRRREAHLGEAKKSREAKRVEHSEERKKLLESQGAARKSVESFLDRKEQPPVLLWPSGV